MNWEHPLPRAREGEGTQVPIAILVTIVVAHWLIDSPGAMRSGLLLSCAAVALATWFAGWRSGLLVAVWGYIAAEFFFGAPPNDLDPQALNRLGGAIAYFLVATLVTWLTQRASKAVSALREANRRLDQASRRKSDLLAGVAHELRNSLSAISVEVDLLRTGALEADARQRTWNMVQRQTAQMKRVIADLLDSARIEREQVALQRELIDIGSAIEQAVADADPLIRAKGQKVVQRKPADLGVVWADPLRISEILGNLLHNASKFSPDGSVITIGARPAPGEVTISVEDAGIGIAPAQLESIFDPFVQGRPAEGLGLGLSLTRHFVEAHGGSIEARSEGCGKGAEFIVHLPRRLGEAKPSPCAKVIAQPAPPSPNVRNHDEASLRLLVVDDNAEAAEALATLLRVKGHHATTAHDGLSALDAARKQASDLIFLDVGLPDMSGQEVAMRLRAQIQGRQPVLFALTGWESDDDWNRTQQAGFDGHLVKPITLEELDQALARGAAAVRSRR